VDILRQVARWTSCCDRLTKSSKIAGGYFRLFRVLERIPGRSQRYLKEMPRQARCVLRGPLLTLEKALAERLLRRCTYAGRPSGGEEFVQPLEKRFQRNRGRGHRPGESYCGRKPEGTMGKWSRITEPAKVAEASAPFEVLVNSSYQDVHLADASPCNSDSRYLRQ
jgi:hypothetical protein